MNKFKKLLKKKKCIIGMIHLPPLLGYEDSPGFEYIQSKALEELIIYNNSDIDAVMVENNYDLPHQEFVGGHVGAQIGIIMNLLKSKSQKPLGICTLWNDYKTSLTIAKILDLDFIRIPAYVDDVITSYGFMKAGSKEALNFRKEIKAENVLIFADVQVKHSEMADKNKSLTQSIKQAAKSADGIIITGKWTGDSPLSKDLALAKKLSRIPIIAGSGITEENIKEIFKFADAGIVGTFLKEGENNNSEVNLKPFTRKILEEKVKLLVDSV